MNKYQKLLSNTIIFAIGTFSSKMLSFLLMPLFTRVLTTEQFGMTDLIQQTGNLLLPIVSCSIASGVIRFGLDRHYKKSDVFTTGLLTITCGFAVLLLFEPLLVEIKYFGENTLMIYVFVLMSNLRNLCAQFVRVKGYVKLYAIDGILATATTIFFNVLYLVVLQLGTTGYMLAIISADACSALFLFYIARLGSFIRIKGLNLSTASEMLRYSIPLIPNSIFWWISNIMSRYIIAHYHGNNTNGLFAAASKVPGVIVIISTIFMDAWQMSAVTDDSGKRAQFFSRVFLCYQALLCTAASGLILFVKVITKILVSDSFYDSWHYMPLLLISTVFSCMATFLGTVYIVEKKSMLNFITTGIGAATNLALNFLLVPSIGVNGAAIAAIASYFVMFILRALDTKRLMPMRFNSPRLIFNMVILASQACIMLLEIKGWIIFETLLTAIMVVSNMSALWATVCQVLFKRRKKA